MVTQRTRPDEPGVTNGAAVFRSEPKPGQPVKTTLDQAVQNAADAALRTALTLRAIRTA